MKSCGLDFGTSNSTLGICAAGAPVLLEAEAGHRAAPTAVFYGAERDSAFLIGRAAMAAYMDNRPGRLMRSLKSALGTSLAGETTQVPGGRIGFTEVIAAYLTELRARAQASSGQEITRVVMGRPVRFVDDDDAGDARAQAALAQAARQAGFEAVSFQPEPIAAASQLHAGGAREKIALIADLGGGTSDFTAVRMEGARQEILATGGVRRGGTDLDMALSLAAFMPHFGYRTPQKRPELSLPTDPYWDLSSWPMVNRLYGAKRLRDLKEIRNTAALPQLVDRLIHVCEQELGHQLLAQVEGAKVGLSDAAQVRVALDWLPAGLSVDLPRGQLDMAIAEIAQRIAATGAGCLREAGLAGADVDLVFFTGGTSAVPLVRQKVLELCPGAQAVTGDMFGAVGLGLAAEAARRYG